MSLNSLEEIDKHIKAIQDMLQIWDTDELKECLCEALELRALALLQYDKEGDSNDILN